MSKFKIKVLSRNPDDYIRETKKDIHKMPRNYDRNLHPFEAPREYTRAINATKLEKVFAKPFLGALEGHRDGVHCLCKHPKKLSIVVSGCYDGEVRIWNVPNKKCIRAFPAHNTYVRGLCFNPSGEYFFSCGDDKTVKQWHVEAPDDDPEFNLDQPVNTIIGKSVFHSMDHHWQDNLFATCGEQTDIWDEERSEPIRTFKWGVDSVNSVKFNPVETNILGATASDRSIILYDMRGSAPLRKVILKMKSNVIAWNPMEAFTFTAANEDYNLYTFDMRKLDEPLKVHADHVLAVLDVEYSPTGKEFVSGSYDKTIRIFSADNAFSRQVYHAKRMQRIQCVSWSLDNKFLLSGSDETNIRIWKANASEKLGVLRPREVAAMRYNDKLKEKFQHHPQIKRIEKHRHLPRSIFTARRELQIIRQSQKLKEYRRRAHSKPGKKKEVRLTKKNVVGEIH